MIRFGTGNLDLGQIECIFGTLPLELTFVDDCDIVRFYNCPGDMVFTRSKEILGRSVLECHSEESREMVGRILRELRGGDRDVVEFVKRVNGRVMHIRYMAARDECGTYVGCLEVAQDITRIAALVPTGE